MALQLRAYQQDDVRTMGEILGDHGVVWNLSEMRVGKLVELIALIRRLDTGMNLIIAPLSTLLNVRDEFKRWLGWHVWVNPPSLYEADSTECTVDQPIVVAINPEKLRDPDHWVFKVMHGWDLVALDECHRYRGRRSQQTQGAFELAKRAKRLVLMTGTPLMNGLPREIWPLLRLSEIRLNREERRFNSFWKFLSDHAVQRPGWGGAPQDEAALWTKPGKARVQSHIAPMVVRRTYAEVRPELPAVVEQTIRLDLEALDPEHWAGYRTLEEQWRVQCGDETLDVPTKLALTTRLSQYAASPRTVFELGTPGGKVKAIAEWVQDQTGKGIIWTWHRAVAEAVQDALDKLLPIGSPIFLLHGGDPVEKRQTIVNAFQQRQNDGILIATIASLKEGISLDTASWCAFAERSWLPSDNQQAAARIQGPNQTGSPLVTTFVCAGTIEEKVEKVLARKDREITSFMMMEELLNARET